jgi:hypothetical protein
MSSDELTGDDRRLAEALRGLGWDAAAARVRADREQLDLDERLASAMRGWGLSESTAQVAAAGRDRRPAGTSSANTSEAGSKPLPLTRPAAAEEIRLRARQVIAEASEPGISSELRDGLLDNAEQILRLADRVEAGSGSGAAVKPKASQPAKRIVEVDGRRMVEEVSLLTGQTVLSEPRQRRGRHG